MLRMMLIAAMLSCFAFAGCAKTPLPGPCCKDDKVIVTCTVDSCKIPCKCPPECYCKPVHPK